MSNTVRNYRFLFDNSVIRWQTCYDIYLIRKYRGLANVCEIHTLREKCRRLVSYFKLSTTAKDKLTEVQQILGIPCHKLILEVLTRWNSTYQMFERLNEQRPAVIFAISASKINFTSLIDTEWELLGKLLPILKPFLLATNEISAEKSVSISKVLMIKKQLDIFFGTFPLNGIEGKLCVELMSQVLKYLSDMEANEMYACAALLDLRFRDLPFTSDIHFQKARDHLISSANCSNGPPTREIGNLETSMSPVTEDENSFWASFDNYIEGRNTSSLDGNDVQLQLDNYFKESYLARKKSSYLLEGKCKKIFHSCGVCKKIFLHYGKLCAC